MNQTLGLMDVLRTDADKRVATLFHDNPMFAAAKEAELFQYAQTIKQKHELHHFSKFLTRPPEVSSLPNMQNLSSQVPMGRRPWLTSCL